MKSELQTIRDYRALLKARMECGCLMSTSSVPCNTHGPRDVADVMLVSCIFMSEHIRHYGVPVRITARNLGELPHNAIPKVTPLPPKAGKITWTNSRPPTEEDTDEYGKVWVKNIGEFHSEVKCKSITEAARYDFWMTPIPIGTVPGPSPHSIPEVTPIPPSQGPWETLANELATVWWWCHNNNANLQHGELGWDTTYSICLMGGVPGRNTFHADTPLKVMEKAKARLAELPTCGKCKTPMRMDEMISNWRCDTCDKAASLECMQASPSSPHEERVQLLSASAPTPPAEWKLPEPPAGYHWHRNDWVGHMLPEGYRPMMAGEQGPCEMLQRDGTWKQIPKYQELQPCLDGHPHQRTTAPLPVESPPSQVPVEEKQCQICNWCNTDLLNMGSDASPNWMCRNCIWSMRERITAERDAHFARCQELAAECIEKDKALADLRALYAWVPVAAPPTDEDAQPVNQRGDMRVRYWDGCVAWYGSVDFPNGATHWQRLSPLPTAPVVEDAGKAFFDAYFKAVSTPSTLPKWEELTAETMEIWRSRAAFLASQNSTKP